MTDEEVEEVEPDDGGWTKVQKSDGTQGLVPTDYLSGCQRLFVLYALTGALHVNMRHYSNPLFVIFTQTNVAKYHDAEMFRLEKSHSPLENL